jgi:hypothetical protein
MATPLDFAKALLDRLSLSRTQNRLIGLVDFAAREGGHWGNSATRFNPFNTSLPMPGATNAVGAVKAYTSWEQGIEATARTIAQSNMRPILDALKDDADPHTFLHSITLTPWCPQNIPGCQEYDVGDPIALFNGYANRQDSGTSLSSGGTNWKTAAAVGGVVAVAGAAVWWLKTRFLR